MGKPKNPVTHYRPWGWSGSTPHESNPSEPRSSDLRKVSCAICRQYLPLCQRCKRKGHLTNQCSWPKADRVRISIKAWCVLVDTTWHVAFEEDKPQAEARLYCRNLYVNSWVRPSWKDPVPVKGVEYREPSCSFCRTYLKYRGHPKVPQAAKKPIKMSRTRAAREQGNA